MGTSTSTDISHKTDSTAFVLATKYLKQRSTSDYQIDRDGTWIHKGDKITGDKVSITNEKNFGNYCIGKTCKELMLVNLESI